MHFIHVPSNNSEGKKVEEHIAKGDDVFVLVYMEGCGPCNATRPEWAKIEDALKNRKKAQEYPSVVVADVNKDFLEGLNSIGAIDGFPTMKYIGQRGELVEPYENSAIPQKDRSVASFVNWIESKMSKQNSSVQDVYDRLQAASRRSYKKTKKTKTKTKTKKQKGGRRTRRTIRRRQRRNKKRT